MTSSVPSVALAFGATRRSTNVNSMGMRPMQERVWQMRGEQYLLIKSPPASGKSRALMFLALDKIFHQNKKQAIVAVPERSISGSFANTDLKSHGFFADWKVEPKWDLCNMPSIEDEKVAKSKVKAFGEFLASEDKFLICTHATLRFAIEALGVEAFDDRLLVVDEFHHVSSNPDNRLGSQIKRFLERDKVDIVAMTGSYFRGDSAAVLSPEDEAKFKTVTYTYYEQLNGYQYLKAFDIGYYFYAGSYLDAIDKVLDPDKKTILHIPNVNSRENVTDKYQEVENIIDAIGAWEGVEEETGFHLVKLKKDGRVIKIADLVDDHDLEKRSKVLMALKDPKHAFDRDHVDIIIALGMAKEGFDWIWCEHALTVGYRGSLTEIVQIIGRATRDAPGKTTARFTNLIAEPDADDVEVVGAVNDTLKAIAACLLMEQVLVPRFEFTPKDCGGLEGFDYGGEGYVDGGSNVGFNPQTGTVHVEIGGLTMPKSDEAKRICSEDINELVASFVQDGDAAQQGIFNRENTIPEELTVVKMGKIVRDRYPELSDEDQEAVRQCAIAALNIAQQAHAVVNAGGNEEEAPNVAFINGVRRFVNVHDLDVNLIDRINPFESAYAVLSKSMDASQLRKVEEAVSVKRQHFSEEEARSLAERALLFKKEHGRLPQVTAQDPWEKHLAEGVAAYARYMKAKR
jgi:hypothetical protein